MFSHQMSGTILPGLTEVRDNFKSWFNHCNCLHSIINFHFQYLEDIDEELTSKCSDLKSYIENMESEFSKQLQELTTSLEHNEVKYADDHRLTQEKINAINEKVVETRQIIGGASSGASKVCTVCTARSRHHVLYKTFLWLDVKSCGREGGS